MLKEKIDYLFEIKVFILLILLLNLAVANPIQKEDKKTINPKLIISLPSEEMIKNSQADTYIRVFVLKEAKKEIEKEFKINYPKEVMLCLKGSRNENIFYIDSVEKANMKKQTKYSVSGSCDSETLMKLHTHTLQSYDSCNPSYIDILLDENEIIEGLICGENGNPERLLFYDSYRHYLNYESEEGNYLVYDGFIDTNPFIPVLRELVFDEDGQGKLMPLGGG